ncbi:MAG: hypothetical protein PHY93_14150 [Bacteriovorax sp.]|nr:hypothetical protein [Bacteriovorax sp.]
MSQSQNVNTLFDNAVDDGALTKQSANIFKGVTDIGAQIQNGLGVDVDDVKASEVVLVNILIDDSGSISCIPSGSDIMCSGHNMIVDEILSASKKHDSILLHTRYLNGKVLNPYGQLTNCQRMNSRNYSADGGTPLYDQCVIFLGTVMAKAQEFSDNGVPVRTITLIITDGDDLHSRNNRARDVASIVTDMRRSENHIIAAMGIDDGDTDFRQVFADMGIDPKWILLPSSDPHEIGKSFKLFSQSASRASQNAASFSKTAMGGFGN